jgi:hypothetical protein
LLSHISHLLRYVSWAAAPGPVQRPSQQFRSMPSPPAAPDWANSRIRAKSGFLGSGTPEMASGRPNSAFSTPPRGLHARNAKVPFPSVFELFSARDCPKKHRKTRLAVFRPFYVRFLRNPEKGQFDQKKLKFSLFPGFLEENSSLATASSFAPPITEGFIQSSLYPLAFNRTPIAVRLQLNSVP